MGFDHAKNAKGQLVPISQLPDDERPDRAVLEQIANMLRTSQIEGLDPDAPLDLQVAHLICRLEAHLSHQGKGRTLITREEAMMLATTLVTLETRAELDDAVRNDVDPQELVACEGRYEAACTELIVRAMRLCDHWGYGPELATITDP